MRWLWWDVVPVRRSKVQSYDWWDGKPLALVLLLSSLYAWYISRFMTGRSGLSTAVDWVILWGRLRQWCWHWFDHFVISLSWQKIWGSGWCIQGNPRILECLVETVTRKEMDSAWRALTWRYWSLVQWVITPSTIGPLLVALSFKGCWRCCMGIRSFRSMPCPMFKFPAAPESIKAEKVKTDHECLIWKLSVKDWWNIN